MAIWKYRNVIVGNKNIDLADHMFSIVLYKDEKDLSFSDIYPYYIPLGEPILEHGVLESNVCKDAISEDTRTERALTVHTQERFLPRILIECGITDSIKDVKMRKPEYMVDMTEVGIHEIKWSKNKTVWVWVTE